MSVSLYCSTTHLKVLTGSPDKGGVGISAFGEYELPAGAMINGIITDENAMIGFLKQVATELDLQGKETYLVIDNNNIKTKVLSMPPVGESQMVELLTREAESDGVEIETSVIDFAIIGNAPKSEGGVRVLSVAVDRQILQSYRNVVLSAGYDAVSINVGLNSVIKLSALLGQLRDGNLILAAVDDQRLLLSLFTEGGYVLSNKYRLIADVDTEEWHREIGGNISSVMQFQMGQNPQAAIGTAYFAGTTAAQTAAIGGALSYLNIGIQDLDLASIVHLKGAAEAKGADFLPGKYLYNIGTLLRR